VPAGKKAGLYSNTASVPAGKKAGLYSNTASVRATARAHSESVPTHTVRVERGGRTGIGEQERIGAS